MGFRASLYCTLALAAPVAVSHNACAAERITLRNGFAIRCDHHLSLNAEHTRLFLDGTSLSYLDVPSVDIAAAEADLTPLPNAPAATGAALASAGSAHAASPAPLDTLLCAAGAARQINLDLLRSVVHAESGGRIRAVSHAGAQGLMQLMPATAQSLGVTDSFAPEQNLRGGTDYLDTLLRRYHEDLALALAAYNAGPAAVDRYHGIPPYRETRLYVARIIREFNRRTLLAKRQAAAAQGELAAR